MWTRNPICIIICFTNKAWEFQFGDALTRTIFGGGALRTSQGMNTGELNWEMCVKEIPGTLSLVRNVLSCPPGGEGWPRNSKNENLSASLSANCNISHLVRLQLPWPVTRIDTLSSQTQTLNISLNWRNSQYWEKPEEFLYHQQVTKILLIGNHCEEFRVRVGQEIWLWSPQILSC